MARMLLVLAAALASGCTATMKMSVEGNPAYPHQAKGVGTLQVNF